jgi:hypothetical protein
VIRVLEISYAPAVTGTEVGGGWYDAFWLYETISYVSEMRVTVA